MIRCSGMLVMMALSLLTGCSSGPQVIPPELEAHLDRSLSFHQLRASADQYRGHTVLLGGEVLSAKRMNNGTQLEILQLPVNEDDPPAERRSDSQGRFLAATRDAVDPASLPPGTRVTVIGEVTGDVVQRLDESDYRYPTVEVKHLHVWEPADYQRRRSAYPRVGLFGGMGLGMGGGGGSFGGLSIGTGF